MPEGGVFDALAMLLAGTPGATLGVPGSGNRRLGVLLGSGSERLDEDGCCMDCGTPLPGVFEIRPGSWGRQRQPVRLHQ